MFQDIWRLPGPIPGPQIKFVDSIRLGSPIRSIMMLGPQVTVSSDSRIVELFVSATETIETDRFIIFLTDILCILDVYESGSFEGWSWTMTDNIRGTLGYSGHADKWRKPYGVGGNFDRIFQLKIWRGGKVMEKGCNFDETFNVSIERFL